MTKDVSFETLDLLATLGNGRKNAKPIALLARQMDVSRRKVIRMIELAREELEDTTTLIMSNGHGGFYLQEAVADGQNEELLELFR